jgi:hypothetical protein
MENNNSYEFELKVDSVVIAGEEGQNEAIKLELNNLIRFGTRRYVKRPKDQAVVSTRWVF